MAPRTGYCTVDDLSSVVPAPQLARYTAETGTEADTDVLDKLLADIADEIDGYLGGRYAIPVIDTAALALLRPRALAMAKVALLGRRDLDAKDDPNRVAYDNAVKWLQRIASRDADLPPSTPAASTSSTSVGGIVFGSDCHVFREGFR